MFVTIVGKKSRLITRTGSTFFGEREPSQSLNGQEVIGQEWISFTKSALVRTEEESELIAPKGTKCPGGHSVKEGESVYFIGPKQQPVGSSFFCTKHYLQIPSLYDLIELYSKPFYNVTITNKSDDSVIFKTVETGG